MRSGTCKFYVKYFGCCEVYESRGMQVCEAAVESLKAKGRRTVRGSMYVSGDSIRLAMATRAYTRLRGELVMVASFQGGFQHLYRAG